jgi:hypothetical protein
MRVYITKDCYDGSKSRVMECDLDGMSMTELIFLMMTAKVASITITKKFDVRKAVAKADPEEDSASN